MPRAYTKSGSIEKYESSEWSTPTWSQSGLGSISGPDSNGNYTVTPYSNYKLSTSSSSKYCMTRYHGVPKYFYFSSSYLDLLDYVALEVTEAEVGESQALDTGYYTFRVNRDDISWKVEITLFPPAYSNSGGVELESTKNIQISGSGKKVMQGLMEYDVYFKFTKTSYPDRYHTEAYCTLTLSTTNSQFNPKTQTIQKTICILTS